MSRAALTSVGSKMKGGRTFCVVYMCACVYIYTHSPMYVSDRKRESVRKRGSHVVSEREGTRVRACVHLNVRVMGRVCVRLCIP